MHCALAETGVSIAAPEDHKLFFGQDFYRNPDTEWQALFTPRCKITYTLMFFHAVYA